MSTNEFLPEGYEAPASGGAYFKLNNGDNKIIVLTRPELGWLGWTDSKPERFRYNNEPKQTFDRGEKAKHFWAFAVFDTKDKKIKVCEITQKSIQNAIINLTNDSDWGNPILKYGLNIKKEGEGMETNYAVVPFPLNDSLRDEAEKQLGDTFLNLPALFEGGDPFDEENAI